MLLCLSSAYCINWSTCNGHIDFLNFPLHVERTATVYISHWDLDHLPWLLEGSIILVEPDSYLKPLLNIEPLYFVKSFHFSLLNKFFLLELYQGSKCNNPEAYDIATVEIPGSLHWSRIDLHFSYKWGILSLLTHSYIKIEELVALCHYYLFLQVALYIWFL